MSQDPNIQPNAGDTVEQMAERSGRTVAEIEEWLSKPAGPLVRVHIANRFAALKQRTRETYKCQYERMLRGVGPVCDQTCEPCLNPVRTRKEGTKSWVVDFPCRCNCAACRISQITIMAMGDLRVSAEVLGTLPLAAVSREVVVAAAW